jgi:hypothetical protein
VCRPRSRHSPARFFAAAPPHDDRDVHRDAREDDDVDDDDDGDDRDAPRVLRARVAAGSR